MRKVWLTTLCGVALTLGIAAPVGAAPPLYTFIPSPPPFPARVVPPPTGYLNGPCGLAVDSSSRVYVADYYHQAVQVFTAGSSQASLPGYVTQKASVDSDNGPCPLAVDGPNSLYVNVFHENVTKFGSSPSFNFVRVFDTATPTGVAVDATNNVYVNNRTYISVYDSNGVPVDDGGNPLRIGEGDLRDGYGLAVSHFPGTLGYVYVPDAGTNTVKVYDSLGLDKDTPVAELREPFRNGPFISLKDSAIAVDKATGDIYFADTTQPENAERPQATIYAFGATHTWRGWLPNQVISARPPGLAIDNTGNPSAGRVYVTSGNTHQAGWYAYAPGSRVTGTPDPSRFSLGLSATGGEGSGSIEGNLEGVSCASDCEVGVRTSAQVTLTAMPDEGSTFTGWSGGGCSGGGDCTVTMDQAKSVSASFDEVAGPPAPSAAVSSAFSPVASASEISRKGNLQVKVSGKLAPKKLPRDRRAPIKVSVGGEISTVDGSLPPQLKKLRIELNKQGRIDYKGLPICKYSKIQPGSTSRAKRQCRSSLVGQGSFTANITLSGQEPYPTRGKLLVFNSIRGRKPVLYGHIYSGKPFATSFVIVFAIQKLRKSAYGTALDAPLPKAMKAWGRLTGLDMTLNRKFRVRGVRRSYVSAGCPAPRGFTLATFSLARTTFLFEGGSRLRAGLSSTCRVRR